MTLAMPLFVTLAKAVDVEKFEAGPRRRGRTRFFLREGPLVKKLLGAAVVVEWLKSMDQRLVVIVSHCPVAVGRGAAGVDERDFFLCAVIPKFLRVLNVHASKEIDVGFHRVGASAHVDDGVDLE